MASDLDLWQRVLTELRLTIAPEEFRRWFAATAYASDSGDQITVWVPSEGIRRHIDLHYREAILSAFHRLDRDGTAVRLVVAGFDEDEEEAE